MTKTLAEDIDRLIQNIARMYATEGNAKLVSILANAKIKAKITGYDNWNGDTDLYTIYIDIPRHIFTEIQNEIEYITEQLTEKFSVFIHHYDCTWIERIHIAPSMIQIDDWQQKALDWLAGKGITNQGRVRSDNIANRKQDGLLFRSQNEIHFYNALKSKGVAFAPLPVFLRGGETYSRIEPDFIIVKDGITMCVEIDGDTVHNETPAEANSRTRVLTNEGVVVERFSASECSDISKAMKLADHVIELLRKHKENRS
ncbi:hypothetical protein PN441_19650 [Spirulina major CS-329]|uniref:hypothetical protein n=1 Tax=Spirulina TaxID=1154 RepID=UPI00232DE84D|nr:MULTISPECIES: hypothetical protein [Spirulina]MDB9493262.1 hypothetical protein [Spirulina subsalsa CS-330]MDB9505299.1 hypothetical protein [Spirulina major CS-329]